MIDWFRKHYSLTGIIFAVILTGTNIGLFIRDFRYNSGIEYLILEGILAAFSVYLIIYHYQNFTKEKSDASNREAVEEATE